MEQEFKISTGSKIFYSILGMLCVLFSLFLFGIANLNVQSAQILIFLLPIALLALGVLALINQFRAQIIVNTDSIRHINIFENKEIVLSDVKGVRTGSRYFVIETFSGKKITVNNSDNYADSEVLTKWLNETFADQNAADLKMDKAKILNDETLGANESERENKLRKAKQLAISYNLIGVIVTFSTIAWRNVGVSLVLLLFPLLGVLLMLFSKGLIKLVSNSSRSARLWLMLGYVLPIFMMLIKSLGEYEISDKSHLWIPFIGMSLTMTVALFFTGINRTIPVKGQIILMILVGAMYGYGAIVQINCEFDRSDPKVISTMIDGKWIEHTKGTHYHLKLVSWDANKQPKDIEVAGSTYDRYQPGNSIDVELKTGVLNIPWFYIYE